MKLFIFGKVNDPHAAACNQFPQFVACPAKVGNAGATQTLDRFVAQKSHLGISPKRFFASRANSSSLPQSACNCSRAILRNSRRAQAIWLFTSVTESSYRSAKSAYERFSSPSRSYVSKSAKAFCLPRASQNVRNLATAEEKRLRIHSFSKNSSSDPGAGIAAGSMVCARSSSSAAEKSSATWVISPPRFFREAALISFKAKLSAQTRRYVRSRLFAGSKRARSSRSNNSAENPCVRSCASCGAREYFRRRYL